MHGEKTMDQAAHSLIATVRSLSGEQIILILGIILFSLLLPSAIWLSKVFIKDRRINAAARLAKEFPVLAESYTFLFAVAKYVDASLSPSDGRLATSLVESPIRNKKWCNFKEDLPSYCLPIVSYALICFCGFYAALVIAVAKAPDPAVYHFDNYLIYGMHAAAERKDAPKPNAGGSLVEKRGPPEAAPPSESGDAANKPAAVPPVVPSANPQGRAVSPATVAVEGYTEDELIRYGKGTIAVSVAAFVGSYLWTLIFLARRVTNFDLSPFSFLRATIQICLATFVCIFLRHFYDSFYQLVWPNGQLPATSSWLLALAFLVGFYPALGLNYLQERFAFLRFKTRNASADALARELPLDMIDGIDSYIKFRLGEYEIEDVQNLALANPIQLFIETPYPMRKIVDWIGQAQLLLEVDNGKIAELRNLNIRTSLDFLRFGESDEGRKILMGLLHPMQASNGGTQVIAERLRTFNGKPHVRALSEMIENIVGNTPPLPTATITPISGVAGVAC
jgi:hypothetical protein